MTFDLFWFDFWLKDRLFGFGFFTAKGEDTNRSLLAAYWNGGELLIDFFWLRIYADFPFFYWWFYNEKV